MRKVMRQTLIHTLKTFIKAVHLQGFKQKFCPLIIDFHYGAHV